MRLRSYSKRKSVAKGWQGFEDMDIVSDATTKDDLDVEEMEMTPSTPGFVEESSVVESMVTMSMPKPEIPIIKKTYAHVRNVEIVKWQPKTRPTNKIHLNMKKLLNPRL